MTWTSATSVSIRRKKLWKMGNSFEYRRYRECWFEDPSPGFNPRHGLCGPEGRHLVEDPNFLRIDKTTMKYHIKN